MSTAVVIPEVEVPAKQNQFWDNCLLLCITRRWIPQTKTIRSKILQSDADPKMVSATKKLFDSPELRAIIRHDERLSEYLKWKSSPMPLKKGHYVVGADLFHEVENRLIKHNEETMALVDAF